MAIPILLSPISARPLSDDGKTNKEKSRRGKFQQYHGEIICLCTGVKHNRNENRKNSKNKHSSNAAAPSVRRNKNRPGKKEIERQR
jgi:hypothetical protein